MIPFVASQVEEKQIRLYIGGALMSMLDSCGYNDNSGGGGGHCWYLDPVLTPLSLYPSPSPTSTSNTNVGTPTLK